MSQLQYIEIHVPEGEHDHFFGRLIYKKMIKVLQDVKAPGVTVFRAMEGLDPKRRIQNIHSDSMQDSLPVVLEMVCPPNDAERILAVIQKNIHGHPHWITATPALNLKSPPLFAKEVLQMKETAILKIYMKQEDLYHGIPLYHAIVLAGQKKNLLWVNVQRSLEGFGENQVLLRNKTFNFSERAPLMVEITGSMTEIEAFLRENQSLIQTASGPAILLQGHLVTGTT